MAARSKHSQHLVGWGALLQKNRACMVVGSSVQFSDTTYERGAGSNRFPFVQSPLIVHTIDLYNKNKCPVQGLSLIYVKCGAVLNLAQRCRWRLWTPPTPNRSRHTLMSLDGANITN